MESYVSLQIGGMWMRGRKSERLAIAAEGRLLPALERAILKAAQG